MEPAICTLNNGDHKYFVFKTYEGYEPVETTTPPTLFQKIEFAILGCNCGSVIKRKVVQP